MDTKRFFTSMLIAGALMLLFMWWFQGGGGSSSGVEHAFYSKLPQQPLSAEKDAKEESVVLGGADKDNASHLAVRVNSVTAGIDWVKLNVKEYAATVKRKEPLTLFAADPDRARPFATIGIHLTTGTSGKELGYGVVRLRRDDGTVVERPVQDADAADTIALANATNILSSKYIWRLEADKTTATDAVFSATFQSLGKNVARVEKRFHVDPDSYELTITHTVHNLTDQPLKAAIDQTAAPQLARDDPQGDDRYFYGLMLDSAKKSIDGRVFNLLHSELRKAAAETKDATGRITKESGTILTGHDRAVAGQFFDFTQNPNLWIGSANRFFAVVVRPLPEGGNEAKLPLSSGRVIVEPRHVQSAYVDVMRQASKPEDDAAIVRLTGRALDVPPGGSLSMPLSVYLGPKQRDVLNGLALPADAKHGTAAVSAHPEYDIYEYSNLVQFNTCMLYSYCVFDPIAHGILWLLDFFRDYGGFGNYGVAIMILVIVVRAALHPLTRASQINMAKMGKKMRDIQPQLEAVKKRYADNKKKQSEEMMRVYRENNVNPAGGIMGCLPMLVQMPIWAALYSGLRVDIDLRHAAFIPGWINDLASPDTVFPASIQALGQPLFYIPLVGDIYGLNLLPILLTVVFYFQMKVSMASQGKPADEQQAQMQKMSQYMIFIFPLFLYNAPSGLNLYIFASTMGGLLDTYLVRKALKKQGILAPSAPLLPTHEDADGKK